LNVTKALYIAALEFQEKGWPIFPCQPRGKTPACARGCLDATTDIDRINGWWGQFRDLNIGLATGEPSGLYVVDVDGNAGRQTLGNLEDRHGPLPPTLSVITGRDGRGEHFYFRLGAHKVRNSAGLMGPGIDIRGSGGYVLLPPSVHPSGRVYHRSVDSADDVATAPDWLHQIVDDKQNGERGPNGKQTLDYWNALFESDVAEGEGRHEAVIKVAGKLHHCGLQDQFTLFHATSWFNQLYCKPPIDQWDVYRAARYVIQSHLRRSHG
jgi:hypothetical protein